MTKPTFFQRAVSLFTGRRGVPATMPRRTVRRFDAARVDRLASEWWTTNESINQELRQDLDRLRARGRQLRHNNDYARKYVGMCSDNIVGPDGIRLQVRVEDSPGKPDRLANAAIEKAWREWCRVCEITSRQAMRDLCVTLVEGMPSDGEFLVRMVRGAAARNRFNFGLQLIDVDRIDTTYNAQLGASRVTMGVQCDAYGRPEGLWLFTSHPQDYQGGGGRVREFVPVGELVHRFKVERPGQVRGIPWMAPGMLSLHHLGGFMLSALLAAEHGANHYGFFTTPDGNAPGIGAADESGQTVIVSQPGTYDTLPANVGFTPYDSKYPEANFAPFVKTAVQRIASGWRVAYHSLANDLEGVSFSSIRSGTLEERDRWAADQQWLIDSFMEPVYTAWLEMALLSGAITMPNGSALPASKLEKFSKHEWQPRRWEWVDPKADTEAKLLMVKGGLMSPQDLAAGMGYDFEDTMAAIAAARKLAEEYGVPLPAYDGAPGANSGTQQQQADAAARTADLAKAQAEVAELQRVLASEANARQHAETRATIAQRDVAQAVQRATDAAAQAKPATINVDVGLDRAMDSVASAINMLRQEVGDMQIIVNVPEQPAPVVNVAAPVVNVAAPEVSIEATMPAPQVTIAHPARSVARIERDSAGEIIQTTTIHEAA